MVALWVILRDTYILVHVEGDDVLKGDTSSTVSLDKSLIHTQRRGARRQTEDEGLRGCRLSLVDTSDYIVSSPLRDATIVWLDDETHIG
jgi:hypothetical protein